MKKRTSAKTYRARRRKAVFLGVGAAALKGALAFVGGKAAAAVGKGIAAMAMNPGNPYRRGMPVVVQMPDGTEATGHVAYVRMSAASDFNEPEAVSVVLSSKRGSPGYSGTIFPALKVRPAERPYAHNPALAMNPGKQIDPNMVAITLHRNSYPTLLSADTITLLRGGMRGVMSPSDYKTMILSDWENLGIGGGYSSGFSFKKKDWPYDYPAPRMIETFDSRLGAFILRTENEIAERKKERGIMKNTRRNPLLMVVPNPGRPELWELTEHGELVAEVDATSRADAIAQLVRRGDLRSADEIENEPDLSLFTYRYPSGKYHGRHRRNPASDYTKKMAAKSEHQFALKQKARGMTHAIVLPPGRGQPLYTASVSAATAMAKEYGRGTHVMPIDKFISSFGRNPGPAYHAREAKRYSSLLKDDVAAGHGGAAEYWQGALSAEAKAKAVGKKRKTRKIRRNIVRSHVQVMAEMGASAKAQAVVRKFLAAQVPAVRAKLEGMTVDNLLELIHKHHTKK